MFVWAFSQPIGAGLSERFGRKSIVMLGALISACGLAATGLVDDYWTMVGCRCVTALGFGTVIIGLQAILVDGTDPARRALSMATLIGGLLAAGICGPALGGVIAERIGEQNTFLIGATMAFLALLVLAAAARNLPKPARTAPERRSGMAALGMLGNRSFAALMILMAIPTKLAGRGDPVRAVSRCTSADIGIGTDAIGRVQMMYFVAFIITAPLAASYSDKLGERIGIMVMGGIGTLTAIIPILWTPDAVTAAMAAFVLGASQAAIASPQLALVTDLARAAKLSTGQGTVIGLFRLIERIGAVIAPPLAAALTVAYGYETSILMIAAGTALAACLMPLLVHVPMPPQSPESDSPPRSPTEEILP